MSRPTRQTVEGRAYLDLRNKARKEGRPTDELLQLYALEGFLARLAVSGRRAHFVLKGGVLLAALGTRRPTRDIDVQALQLSNDAQEMLGVLREVAAVDHDDGLAFDTDQARVEVIRDDDEYAGVRVSMTATLSQAQMSFHIDVNVGDPVWPAPAQVQVPRLLGGEPIDLPGYPLHMVHAEKIVTAVQRGVANTRWRDFGDVWTLSGVHSVLGDDLQTAMTVVADYRGADLVTLEEVLDGYADLAHAKWASWRRRQRMDHLPATFVDVLAEVLTFADPALLGQATGLTWHPVGRRWQ